MGGLDLESPFVSLYLIRNKITKIPDSHMDRFFIDEEATYRRLKVIHGGPNSRRASYVPVGLSFPEKAALDNEPFMNFEEYTRYREQTSFDLKGAYQNLIREPAEDEVTLTSDVASVLEAAALPEHVARRPPGGRGRGRGRGGRGGYSGRLSGVAKVNWDRMSSYQGWIIQLYAPDMIARFGGLGVVEKGLLPTGMVSMFRRADSSGRGEPLECEIPYDMVHLLSWCYGQSSKSDWTVKKGIWM
jgi:hypothetical protein